ncbi:MAG: FHA domain-containing protein [Chitinophagales bacterium]|nr:FHA domain-containing protein [Chitinophagales bacterium]
MRITEKKQKSFTQSLGAGINAIAGSKSTFFVLEHIGGSASYRPGDREEIIVNYVELGRDPKCGIRFSERDKTVSRVHAAIAKEGNGYVLMHLSKTNPTLLNGRPVNNKWYLQSGDQIQLSAEGPKMNFIIPSNNVTSSIGLSRRLSLFGKQVLRPYRTAVTILSILLLFTIAGGAFAIVKLNSKNEQMAKLLRDIEELRKNEEQKRQHVIDSLASLQSISQESLNRLQSQISRLLPGATAENGTISPVVGMQSSADYSQLHKDIYFIVGKDLTLKYPTGEREILELAWTGTGFLTTEGYFVTARHVVEPWYFPTDQSQILINALLSKGVKVEAGFKAISPTGKVLEFKSTDFKVNRTQDVAETIEIPGGTVTLNHAMSSPHDWAYATCQETGSLVMDRNLSNNIQQGTELIIFGYPLGLGVNEHSITPLFAKTTAALNGLTQNNSNGCPAGLILSTTISFDHGNSGGPVIVNNNGNFMVVGIVSGGIGEAVGRFVPVSALQ